VISKQSGKACSGNCPYFFKIKYKRFLPHHGHLLIIRYLMYCIDHLGMSPNAARKALDEAMNRKEGRHQRYDYKLVTEFTTRNRYSLGVVMWGHNSSRAKYGCWKVMMRRNAKKFLGYGDHVVAPLLRPGQEKLYFMESPEKC